MRPFNASRLTAQARLLFDHSAAQAALARASSGSDEVQALGSFTKVVLREDQVTYTESVEPAIHLLADKGFASANQEFLAALNEYHRGRYGDCLTKCGSAFKSTMKLICDRRRWAYQPTDQRGRSLCRREEFRDGRLLRVAAAHRRDYARPTRHGTWSWL
jgi:hypothetical protein